MSKKPKKKKTALVTKPEKEQTEECPFDEVFTSSFEGNEEFKIKYSTLSHEKMEEQINTVLDYRDHVLIQTTLRGCGGAYVPEETFDVQEDYPAEGVVYLDPDEISDSRYKMYGSFPNHIGRNARFKGLFRMLLAEYRSDNPRYKFHFSGGTEAASDRSVNEVQTASKLYRIACGMSKFSVLAQISSQIREYAQTYAKDKCRFRAEPADDEHGYRIIMTHYDAADGSIVPTESEPTVITVPAAVYEDLGSENATAEYLNLSVYDLSYEHLVQGFELLKNGIEEKIGDPSNPKKPKKEKLDLVFPDFSESSVKGLVMIIAGVAMVSMRFLILAAGIDPATDAMGQILNTMLYCTQYCGIVMMIFGVYKTVMSIFLNI